MGARVAAGVASPAPAVDDAPRSGAAAVASSYEEHVSGVLRTLKRVPWMFGVRSAGYNLAAAAGPLRRPKTRSPNRP